MKVGEIYGMQWGYDQTNNSFFRVKALRGTTQAIIQEVKLGIKNITNQGFMCEDREYDTNNYTIVKNPIFLNDNEKGQIVKRQEWTYGGETQECFRVGGHVCTPYNGEKLYESWYA